jgi:hypothetical protein
LDRFTIEELEIIATELQAEGYQALEHPMMRMFRLVLDLA